MQRVYKPYWEWEDWKFGMWRKVSKEEEEVLTSLSFSFMTDLKRFEENMKIVVNKWPNTMLHNLTNTSMNRIAFIGQCASCYAENIPESITRKVWKTLPTSVQEAADKAAKNVLKSYVESKNK